MKLNVVPARTGIQWVKLGIRTFMKQPLALAGLFFIYMVAVFVLARIPVVGVIVAGLLVPGATLGLMAASRQASEGKFPMPTVLLSAFRAGKERVSAMLVLGLLYTLGSTAATGIASLIAGPGTPEPNQIDNTTLLALALHTPLFMMFWHAPALVHWHGVTPVKSLFFSFVACVRNIGALLLYGFLWMGVFLASGMVFALVGGAIGGAEAARAVMTPVALLMAAMFSTSVYFTFRDSFVATNGDLDDPAPPARPQP